MTVTEINAYISRTLKFDPILNNTLIVGEISNFNRHSSGHLYFSLKDKGAKISCVMFRSDAQMLDYDPIEGEKTEIRGSIGVYEKEGRYQIYVNQMAPIGKGELHKAFLKLKESLLKEGYFVKQQPLQANPKRIGIVTSPTGAALRDMLTVLNRRNPNVEIVIYPVRVQGESAAREIACALDYFNETQTVDTIIIGRGGGSIEELWAFNEQIVAESIFASKIPVISGVGHETDFTISDFVADLRAATPTEAAEKAAESLKVYREGLHNLRNRLIYGIGNQQKMAYLTLERYSEHYLCQLVEGILTKEKSNIDSLYNILHNKLSDLIKGMRNELNIKGSQLDVLSPLKTINRGFAIVEKNGKAITTIDDVEPSDTIEIILRNGIIKTEVISKEGKLLNEKN